MSFGRKIQRKNRPDLMRASNQLSRALDSLKTIEAAGQLTELGPVIKQTHQLILTASEDVRDVAVEMARHRAVLEILTRHNQEARVLLLKDPEEDVVMPELKLELAEVK